MRTIENIGNELKTLRFAGTAQTAAIQRLHTAASELRADVVKQQRLFRELETELAYDAEVIAFVIYWKPELSKVWTIASDVISRIHNGQFESINTDAMSEYKRIVLAYIKDMNRLQQKATRQLRRTLSINTARKPRRSYMPSRGAEAIGHGDQHIDKKKNTGLNKE